MRQVEKRHGRVTQEILFRADQEEEARTENDCAPSLTISLRTLRCCSFLRLIAFYVLSCTSQHGFTWWSATPFHFEMMTRGAGSTVEQAQPWQLFPPIQHRNYTCNASWPPHDTGSMLVSPTPIPCIFANDWSTCSCEHFVKRISVGNSNSNDQVSWGRRGRVVVRSTYLHVLQVQVAFNVQGANNLGTTSKAHLDFNVWCYIMSPPRNLVLRGGRT